jgi:hypothetical protein
MIDHEAVYNTHENIVSIINDICYDKDGYQVIPDEILVNQEINRLTLERNKTAYRRQRAREYPTMSDQLDMLWHAIDSGTLDKDSEFYTTLKSIKDNNPKPV